MKENTLTRRLLVDGFVNVMPVIQQKKLPINNMESLPLKYGTYSYFLFVNICVTD